MAQSMSAHGIAALPRNYELFYEAMSGRLPHLSQDLASLGTNPAQDALDALGLKHHLVAHAALAADTIQAVAEEALGDMAKLLKSALAQKRTFKDELDHFAGRLDADPVASLSDFADDARRLREAIGRLTNEEGALQREFEASARRFAELKSELAENARTLTRDPATGLPNRLALTAKLDAILETEHLDQSLAVVVASVEGLRQMAEQHGGTVTAKALAKLSTLFRRSIKKNDFVARIGQQEFAFLCRDVSADNAEAIARRLQQQVRDLRIALPGRTHTVETLSFTAGVTMAQPASTSDELLRQADLALSTARSSSGIRSYSVILGGDGAKTYGHHAA
ncbi:GGDEF domain-containing protein [Ensifer sp.]|uniref:GGDEF domain-containing protein n=1 Tax=Ensifer sp. TaxID=1872086 RepID=UPI002E0D6C8D|nr:GGDEF domain-containing protein [Ensifer sp.]